MITFKLCETYSEKIKIYQMLENTKLHDKEYTIIDIGGGKEKHVSNKFSFIDAYADIRKVDTSAKHFSKNLNHPDAWEEMVEYAKTYGKFDYCICSHTLEDLSICMEYVSKKLPEIAKEGLISVPSKHCEFLKFELDKEYRGYLHHKIIFTVNNDHVLVFPKASFIDSNLFDNIACTAKDKQELSIHWKQKIPIKIFNNGWMGPNARQYRDMFLKEIS
tara:strand:+ start:51 stop:704 length:654 start_codon:yes stop_codon:yes gene_type:complete